jgi:predicted secreted protein
LIRTQKIALTLALGALALGAAPAAMAASPAQQGYDETTVLGDVDTPTPAPEAAPVQETSPVQETAPVAVESVATQPATSESSLPFTGAVLGLLLGGTGLVLRRVVRQRPTS